MVRWRRRDDTTERWRWCDGMMAMVWWDDDDGAMVWWRWSDALSHHLIPFSYHRYRVITPSCYRLCTCAVSRKYRQDNIVVFSCYDLYITNQTYCMLVLNAFYFLSFYQFVNEIIDNATRTDSWYWNHSLMNTYEISSLHLPGKDYCIPAQFFPG